MILFQHLSHSIDREDIQLVKSMLWLKIWPCLPKCDMKDFMSAVGSSFKVLFSSEEKEGFCRIKVEVDVRKPLHHGIIVTVGVSGKFWVPSNMRGFQCSVLGMERLDIM